MPLKREFHIREGHLLVVVAGSFDVDDALERFPAIFHACRRTGQDRVLIDNRALEGRMNTSEEMTYAAGVLGHYEAHLRAGGSPVKLAYVANSSFIKTWQPGVNMAKKEGLDVFATAEMSEAEEWLAR